MINAATLTRSDVRDCRGLGRTGHCSAGKHQSCSYSIGGATARGIWTPECYVTIPPKSGRQGTDAFQGHFTDGIVAQLPGVGFLQVVRPSHVYRCPCDCHLTGQLELFGVARDG